MPDYYDADWREDLGDDDETLAMEIAGKNMSNFAGNTFKTPEETIADILGRYSVTDLTEQTDDDLKRADELFYKAAAPIEVVEDGTTNLIHWWKVRSGGKDYEVRRFKNFCFCSCKDFFFRRKACKHIAVTAGVLCEHCGEMRAKVDKLCYGCHTNRTAVLKGRIADAPRRQL